MTALVLSGSNRETAHFVRENGIGYGVRHVVRADNIRGRRPTSIHILPSYYERRDVHAINAALKHVQRAVRHIKPIEYDLIDGSYIARDAATAPAGRAAVMEAMADDLGPEEDTGPDAVPGQTGIDEHIAAAENEGLAAEPDQGDDLPDWMKA